MTRLKLVAVMIGKIVIVNCQWFYRQELFMFLFPERSWPFDGGKLSINGRSEETAIAVQRVEEDEGEGRGDWHAAERGTGTLQETGYKGGLGGPKCF